MKEKRIYKYGANLIHLEVTCDNCNESFFKLKGAINKEKRNFCSRKCTRLGMRQTVIKNGGKVCAKCGLFKLLENYYSRKKAWNGISSQCKDCMKVYSKQRWIDLPESERRRHKLKYSHNLDLEAYDSLLKKQRNTCAICKNEENTVNKTGNIVKLSVDHSHSTGKIRGLLCYQCNHGLGNFKDNVEYLKSAIKYLKKNGDLESFIKASASL